MKVSKRSENITQSEIRAMSIACRERDGINLAQGVCDTETPQPVIDGAVTAMKLGKNSYTAHHGISEIRDAIAKKELRDRGIAVDPHSEIVVTAGATGALYSALLATLDVGDEVIVFEPYYGYHISTLEALGIGIRYVRLNEPDWTFSVEQVKSQIRSKTKGIIINTPGNPSGKVWSRDELELIGTIAEENDLIIYSDEIYEYFVYEGEHISPISIPRLRERTILIGGFSKTFSVTGWRVGYTIAPREISEAISHLSDLVYVCAPAPLQYGVAEGINSLNIEHYKELCEDHLEKREMICRAFENAGITVTRPHGAYYLLADLSELQASSSRERAIKFLETTGIAGVPGSAFFHDNSGDHLVRFCYAKEKSIIEECCKRIEKVNIKEI